MEIPHSQIKDYVERGIKAKLTEEIMENIVKPNMVITELLDPTTYDKTYTGTISTQGLTNTITGITGINTTNILPRGLVGTVVDSNSVQEMLRVVEYTKDGKTTRVELQVYDSINDDWVKVPRLKLEE